MDNVLLGKWNKNKFPTAKEKLFPAIFLKDDISY